MRRLAYYLAGIVTLILVWHFVSTTFFASLFFPPPAKTFETAMRLIRSGQLQTHMWASMGRIFAGFLVGSFIGFPIGLLLGTLPRVRMFCEPYVQLFRFIPPIAWVSPFIIWLGIGEPSKIALIIYTTAFVVLLSTMTGVLGIIENKLRAARSLAANPVQFFFNLTLPATIPSILTGMRLAMANSFMTVVSAEKVATDEGLGFMIISARLFMALDQIFVGIIALGLMGWATDSLLRFLIFRFGARYQAVG